MISDLGLAWRQDSVSTGELIGVLPYMAPELLSGGARPELPSATPLNYIKLMKSCWNTDPKERPIARSLIKSFDEWIHDSETMQLTETYDSFQSAENERKNLITYIEEDYTSAIGPSSQLISIK
ncbi:unnamed protein product [Rhizophagus irregularis]|nr:unnamed protein product [Rhizophagus irregularis]